MSPEKEPGQAKILLWSALWFYKIGIIWNLCLKTNVAKELSQMTDLLNLDCLLNTNAGHLRAVSMLPQSTFCFYFYFLPVSKDEQNSDLEEVYFWIRFD